MEQQLYKSDNTFKYEVYHRENQRWVQSLGFYEDENIYLWGLIKQIQQDNKRYEMANCMFVSERGVSLFGEEIEELKELIHKEEIGFCDDAKGVDFLFGDEIYEQHFALRERFHDFEQRFLSNKKALYSCLANNFKCKFTVGTSESTLGIPC
jgi:hypothetical protein